MTRPTPSRRELLSSAGLAATAFLLVPVTVRAEAALPGLAGVGIQAELRAEYVRGVPMLVPIVVSNQSDQTVRAPDLAERPWLLRFEFVLPDGRKLRYATTPPDSDGGRMVTLPVRGQRRTLVEIPGAAGIAAGSYELAVQLVDGEVATDIARQAVTVADPQLVAGDLGPGALAGTKAGLQAAWLHRAAAGFDLYLHRASVEHPAAVLEQRWLAHVDVEVAPWLAAARAVDAASPALVWREGDHDLRVLRVDPAGSVLLDQRVAMPWPHIAVAGRPAWAGGAVHVPVWVPAPAGRGGELRCASIDSRGRPVLALLARLPARPDAVESAVTSGGSVLFMVWQGAGLDLYSLPPGGGSAGSTALPGRRLWTSGDGGELVHASFQTLPDTDALPGGLSVLVLLDTDAGLGGRWLDLQGNERLTLPLTTQLPEGELSAVLGGGPGYPALLYRSAGQLSFVQGPARQVLPRGSGPLALVRDADGQTVLRQLGRSAPVITTALAPSLP